MAEWEERPFPVELGRNFISRAKPDISVATFHSDGIVTVSLYNQAAVELVERILAAGYIDFTQAEGPENVRSFLWQSDQPAPDAGALVFVQS